MCHVAGDGPVRRRHQSCVVVGRHAVWRHPRRPSVLVHGADAHQARGSLPRLSQHSALATHMAHSTPHTHTHTPHSLSPRLPLCARCRFASMSPLRIWPITARRSSGCCMPPGRSYDPAASCSTQLVASWAVRMRRLLRISSARLQMWRPRPYGRHGRWQATASEVAAARE